MRSVAPALLGKTNVTNPFGPIISFANEVFFTLGARMNAWKIIWNVFYNGSSRLRVATEMWRLSSVWQRVLIVVSTALFGTGLVAYMYPGSRGVEALLLAVVGELILLVVLDRVKDETFFSEYGHPDRAMVPPDNDEHRVSRYMIFRKGLRDANVTKSHVEDAFSLAEAKLDLESSRGEMPRKYLGFAIGLLAGALVSWSRNLEAQELALAISALVAASFFIVLVLWVIPSRTERLKELKYFMHLYCREVE